MSKSSTYGTDQIGRLKDLGTSPLVGVMVRIVSLQERGITYELLEDAKWCYKKGDRVSFSEDCFDPHFT